MTTVSNDNDFWEDVETTFRARNFIDRNVKHKHGEEVLAVSDRDFEHFKGALEAPTSDVESDLESFKSRFQSHQRDDEGTKNHIRGTFFPSFELRRGRTISTQSTVILFWQEDGKFSQIQQTSTTTQAGEHKKVDSNLVYQIEDQDPGVYVTVNIQRHAQKRKQSEIQVLASTTTFLRKLYKAWYDSNLATSTNLPINPIGQIPSYIKHYGFTFVGGDYWAIFEAVPETDQQMKWCGCALRKIDEGTYSEDDYLRLIRQINGVSLWGLTKFAEGLRTLKATVSRNTTNASKADTTSSSSEDTKRSGTATSHPVASSKGTSIPEESGMRSTSRLRIFANSI
jgi:hypothetical protein